MSRGKIAADRLDKLLVDRGLADSRTKAQALVMAGLVSSRGARLDKPGARYPIDIPIEIRESRRWVGRGGFKLDGALDALKVDVVDRDALDVGASTGGFTEVLLARGARRVIALDVGRGLLDWGLRQDARVTVVEGVNARYLTPGSLAFVPAVAVIDVSFISLERILPAVVRCLEQGGEILALVKPQFEVGRGRVGRGGIVRDPGLHREVLERMSKFVERRGWGLAGIARSSLPGADGNVEFFLHLLPGAAGLDDVELGRALSRVAADGDRLTDGQDDD